MGILSLELMELGADYAEGISLRTPRYEISIAPAAELSALRVAVRGEDMEAARMLELAKDAELPSITEVCPCAFVIENEIQDLFGITITGLALDFSKHFILNEDAPEKPFCRVPGVSVSTVEVKGEQK